MQPHNLNLRHLRAVAAMRRLGSLTAAASACHLSQPALTQGLARLERSVGVPFFARHPGGVRPTGAGDAIADATEAAMAHLARATRGLSRGARGFARAEELMTGSQLRALVAFADAGSLAGAARATGLSQPSLHRGLRDLEQIVGAALTERNGRGLILTEAGARLSRGARLAMSDLRVAIAETRGTPDDDRPVVIGAMPLARARLLPTALTALLGGPPAIKVRVIEGSWGDLVEPLRDGHIDVMIGALRDEVPPDLRQQPLLVDVPAVVGRAGHPLAGATPTTAELARYGWIVAAPDAPLRARWEAMFAGHALPEAAIECGSVMVTRGLLVGSDLLTLLSPAQVAVEIDGGLLRCIAGPFAELSRTIGLTVRAHWHPGAAQRAALAALAAAAGAVASANVMNPAGL